MKFRMPRIPRRRQTEAWTAMISIAVTIALLLTFVPMQVSVNTGGLLSISFSPERTQAQEPISTNGMAYAEVNKSGCTVRNGNCQIRLDFFLEPEDVRYYDKYLYLVDTTSPEYLAGYKGKVDEFGNPTNQVQYNKWYEALPREWVNTPFHSHFIYLPADFTDDDIKAQIDIHLGNFYKAFQDRWDEVQGGMRHGWATDTRIRPTDYSKAETPAEYDARVADCQVAIDSLTEFSHKPEGEIQGETFPATEIDVGGGATERSGNAGTGYTHVDKANPANDTGSLDTFEIWVGSNSISVKVGVFSGSGTSYDDRDYEAIGTVTSGAKRTFTGLDIDVVTGDYAGVYHAYARVDTSGGSNVYRSAYGDKFGQGATSYTLLAGWAISLYATGEAAAEPEITNTPDNYGFGILQIGASSNTGISYFTINNTGSMAVDITIQGTDLTGGDDTWELSADASVGENIYGLHAGLDDADDLFDVVVNLTANTFVTNLAESVTQDWGLNLSMPSSLSGFDGNALTGTITLIASAA